MVAVATPNETLPTAGAERITAEVVTLAKRIRFNPIRTLTPLRLSIQLDSFDAGYLRDFAITADAIARRDDTIRPALEKRIKSPARRSTAILLVENLDEAQKTEAEKHKAALQYFYDNLEVTHALERNTRGGLKLLIRQMMTAVPMRYAVHEMVWTPTVDPVSGEDRLSAKFINVPLWFFENVSGRLRFINLPFGQVFGQDMADNEWLVTVGSGIMEPLAVAYMFKQLSLRDWVSYSEKFGMPGLLGKSPAAKDSPGWTALVEAVEAFSSDWAAVVNTEASIDLIETKGAGNLPFPSLVERMDRAIATICRGADLSTMSAGSGTGQGASLQGDESELLEQDDCEIVSETLQQVSKIVIKHLFGVDQPLAYLQIVVPKKKTTDDTVKKLSFLRDSGVPVGMQYARQELGVPPPGEDEEVLRTATQPALPGNNFSALANAAEAALSGAMFQAKAKKDILAAKAKAFAPLVARLQEIVGMSDTEQDVALAKLREDLPRYAKQLSCTEEEITAWMNSIAPKIVEGAVAAAQAQKSK
jgi:hypothetical protein